MDILKIVMLLWLLGAAMSTSFYLSAFWPLIKEYAASSKENCVILGLARQAPNKEPKARNYFMIGIYAIVTWPLLVAFMVIVTRSIVNEGTLPKWLLQNK